MGKRISKELMQDLKNKTSLERSTIYMRIGKIASSDGNVCDIIIYALEFARQNGLNPRNYADPETLAEYKEFRRSHSNEPTIITKTRIIPEKRMAGIKFTNDPDIPQINLPPEKVKEAKRMGTIYPYIYVLENSIREFIKNTLETAFGNVWWDKCAPTDAVNKANERSAKQGKTRFYGTKPPHPIFLVDLDDLRRIIVNNWKVFEPKLPQLPNTQAWIINIFQSIEETRNIIAHNNPITKDDEDKLKVNFREWANRVFK